MPKPECDPIREAKAALQKGKAEFNRIVDDAIMKLDIAEMKCEGTATPTDSENSPPINSDTNTESGGP